MKKRFLGIVCLLYSLIIIYVWFFNYLDNYIAPSMQIYLKVSVVPMIIMGVIFCFVDCSYKFKVSDIVLLVPILMLFFAGDANLTTSLASNKVMKISRKDNNPVIESVPKEEEKKEEDIEINSSNELIDENIYFDIDDPVYSYLADYITYMSGAKAYVGKTIRFRGFAVDYSEFLADGYSAIGKYSITCCAADAEFSGFVVKYDFSKLEEKSWYEVIGTLELAKDNEGYDIVVVNPKSVSQIISNEKQYVYSCNNYGSDACSQLLKYDLEY